MSVTIESTTLSSLLINDNDNCKKGSAPRRTDTADTLLSSNDNSASDNDIGLDNAFFHSSCGLTDEELIRKAEEEDNNDRVLAAGRLLKLVKDQSLLQATHLEILENAKDLEECVADLALPILTADECDESDNQRGRWIKKSESHDEKRDTILYYKVDEESYQYHLRFETPIESSLLVPLLSVFNESELYKTWVPYWTKPASIGLNNSIKLMQHGRARQTIQLLCDVPWPLLKREVIINILPTDDIDHDGLIAVKLSSLSTGDSKNGVKIEAPSRYVTRCDFDGGILFRKCPMDHACLQNSIVQYPKDENLILVGFTMCVDPKMAAVPQAVINFITGTVASSVWAMLLQVAEDIRAGKRPQHEQAIANKRELLYDWVDERSDVMFTRLHDNDNEPKNKTQQGQKHEEKDGHQDEKKNREQEDEQTDSPKGTTKEEIMKTIFNW